MEPLAGKAIHETSTHLPHRLDHTRRNAHRPFRDRLRAIVTSLLHLLRLNARVAGLALRGRWLGTTDVARGYDTVARAYNRAWLSRLRPVTDRLLARIPSDAVSDGVMDLGCGTGYATRLMAERAPAARVTGVDVSAGMLEIARAGAPANARFVRADMLDHIRATVSESVQLVLSTWAIGYSKPAELIRESHRVLRPGGTLAFIVNYFDTLQPIFRAYQKCMLRFPDRVQRAAWPRFPRNWQWLVTRIAAAGFSIVWHEDGQERIQVPEGATLPWLKQTGILAGFDAMLDLSGAAAEAFERELAADPSPIFHHYAAVIAHKP